MFLFNTAVGDEWFKEKSRNACIEASTQTEEQNGKVVHFNRQQLQNNCKAR